MPDALQLALPDTNVFCNRVCCANGKGGLAEVREDSLNLCRHWLAAGDQSIERIAERLGNRQPSNFIRAFRKRFG